MRLRPDPRYADGHPALLLAVVVVLYFVVYGSLLAAGDGLPYVFDNNESFSSYIHAVNMHDHGFAKSYGVTDESYGTSPESHPYVYTHGGNFPRFPVLLLYLLGARSVEMQIAASTFTVGLGALLLAFAFFRRLAGSAFAALLCALLISDYLMFAQWNVVTYRVWGSFLFFASLLCASGCAGPRRRICLALHVPIFAALFYSEITFAVFTAILAAFWVLYELRLQPLRLLLTWASQLSGALVAVAVIIWQNVKYLGREGFMTDLYLTFVARNAAESSEAMYQQVREFADTHNIAFWYNFVDGSSLRSPWEFVQHFFRFELQVYTPALVLLAFVLVLALVANASADRLERRVEPGRQPGRFERLRARVERLSRQPLASRAMTVGLVIFFFVAFIVVVERDHRFAGALQKEFSGGASFKRAEAVALALGSLAVVLWLGASLRGDRHERASGTRTLASLGVPLLSLVFVLLQRKLYDSTYRPLWGAVAQPWGSVVVLKLAIIAATGYAIVVVNGRHRRSEEMARLKLLRPAAAFFGLAFLSYFIVYMLSPGYLFSGYLVRYAPFTVFFHLIPIAIALFALGCWAREEWARWSPSDGLAAVAPLAIPAAAALFIPCYWVVMQLRYADIFPPDEYAFLSRLEGPPYRGASFVANTYAAPVAAATGSWAYYDPEFSKAEVVVGENGYEASRELHYMWLADRDQNPEYQTPQYFICIVPQNLYRGVARVASRRPFEVDGCSDLGIVETALEPGPKLLSHELVESDQSGRDRWAILKLDWDYPAYLEKLDDSENRVRLCAERTPEALSVRVSYVYAHQQGKAETASRLEVYRVGGSGEDEELVAEAAGRRDLLLPADFTGIIRAGVFPATASKIGPEFRSAAVEVFAAQQRSGSCGMEPSNAQEPDRADG